MENAITIKNWKMDYSFLIKNYLNPEMWEKTWTLFQYKNYVITLNIYCIYTQRKEIMFDIKIHYPMNGIMTYTERSINFSLKIEDITFLKRQINSAILNNIVTIEKYLIRESDEYAELQNLSNNEYNRLRDIADKFLDDNNIINDNIREAYIDAYTEEYAQMPNMMEDYVESKIYLVLTDFYLIWLNTLEDDPKKEIRIEEIHDKLGDDEFERVMNEINEYMEYMETSKFEEDMKNNLEDIH